MSKNSSARLLKTLSIDGENWLILLKYSTENLIVLPFLRFFGS